MHGAKVMVSSLALNLYRVIILFLLLYVLNSTLRHLPPLTFHCVGGCWDQPRTVATLALTVIRSIHSAGSHPQTQQDLVPHLNPHKKNMYVKETPSGAQGSIYCVFCESRFAEKITLDCKIIVAVPDPNPDPDPPDPHVFGPHGSGSFCH
jgi:hypothetical protein